MPGLQANLGSGITYLMTEGEIGMTNASGMFWGGKTLEKRLPELIDPFILDRIDCAAYTLAVGDEVYVSPSDQSADPSHITVRKLGEREAFVIPPGQFAFLLTEEAVQVPTNAIAFISIRAKIKFRGLVNVSGFHVDPGYNGQLTFAVFNAGPVPVHLRRGQEIFLIWYAGLDCETDGKKDDKIHMGRDMGLVASVSGELQSFDGLNKKINKVNKDLEDRINIIERKIVFFRVVGSIIIGIAIAVIANLIGLFDS